MSTLKPRMIFCVRVCGALSFALALGCPTAWADEAKEDPPSGPTLLSRMLATDLAGVQEVVFAVRGSGKDGHWYANFG
jgi:hypothetical protein